MQNNDNPLTPTRSVFFIFRQFFENPPTKSGPRLFHFSFSGIFRQELSTQKNRTLCYLKETFSIDFQHRNIPLFFFNRLLQAEQVQPLSQLSIRVFSSLSMHKLPHRPVHGDGSPTGNRKEPPPYEADDSPPSGRHDGKPKGYRRTYNRDNPCNNNGTPL